MSKIKCNCAGRKGNHLIGLEGCTRKIATGTEIPANFRNMDIPQGLVPIYDISGVAVTEESLFSIMKYKLHKTGEWSMPKTIV